MECAQVQESEDKDYSKFYQVMTKVVDGYQRGLSEAIEKNYHYENQIIDLLEELLRSKEMIKYLKAMETRGKNNSLLSKEDIDRQLLAILDIDVPPMKADGKRKLEVRANQKNPIHKNSNR